MDRLRIVLFWIIGISFIAIGALKYLNLDIMSESIFNRAHYPRWFFYIVGAVEFLGGILLLMTASASKRIGSLLIALVMLGAMGTRYLLSEHYTHLFLPAVIFLLAILMSINPGTGTKVK